MAAGNRDGSEKVTTSVCREKTRAVKYLIDHIPDETLSDIAKLIREDGKDWWIDHHYGFGMGVRNLLREGGFD